MPFKIVRNDITKMNTEAIVNTANEAPNVGMGCDLAIYKAAGYDELLTYRKQKIGNVPEGDAFLTPGFNLSAKYIIHAVSPLYTNGSDGEEERLRSCYRNSLQLAKENGIKSIAFPLIATGGYGYPKEEGMRIAVDEINAFLLNNEMNIYLVVFDDSTRTLGKRIYPDLEEYIDQNYVTEKRRVEYSDKLLGASSNVSMNRMESKMPRPRMKLFKKSGKASQPDSGVSNKWRLESPTFDKRRMYSQKEDDDFLNEAAYIEETVPMPNADFSVNHAEETDSQMLVEMASDEAELYDAAPYDFDESHESKLEERMRHISDTFSQYLMYLIQEKKMENSDVYKRAIVDKKVFSKIKNNSNYHPQKLTALCLCVGAKLNLDESKDLLARAGYALSPCDKTDIIFSYFIENEIYDMIELDIQLEEHGLPCIIS